MLTRNRFHYDESDIENMVNINIKAKASSKAAEPKSPAASKPRASNTPDLLQFSILQDSSMMDDKSVTNNNKKNKKRRETVENINILSLLDDVSIADTSAMSTASDGTMAMMNSIQMRLDNSEEVTSYTNINDISELSSNTIMTSRFEDKSVDEKNKRRETVDRADMSALLNGLDDINQSTASASMVAAPMSVASSTKKKSKGGKSSKRKSSTSSAKVMEEELLPATDSVVLNSPEPQQPPVSKARTSNSPDLLQFSVLQESSVMIDDKSVTNNNNKNKRRETVENINILSLLDDVGTVNTSVMSTASDGTMAMMNSIQLRLDNSEEVTSYTNINDISELSSMTSRFEEKSVDNKNKRRETVDGADMSALLNGLDDINQSTLSKSVMTTQSSSKKKSKGGKSSKRKSSTSSAKVMEEEQLPATESVVLNSPESQQPPASKARTSETPDLLEFTTKNKRRETVENANLLSLLDGVSEVDTSAFSNATDGTMAIMNSIQLRLDASEGAESVGANDISELSSNTIMTTDNTSMMSMIPLEELLKGLNEEEEEAAKVVEPTSSSKKKGKKGKRKSSTKFTRQPLEDDSIIESPAPQPPVSKARIAGTPPDVVPVAQSAQLPPLSVLKSCMSAKKKPNSSIRNVVFGSPEVAEFNKASPTTNFTPMEKSEAKRLFVLPAAAAVVEDVDEETEENERILNEWDRLTNTSTVSSEETDESIRSLIQEEGAFSIFQDEERPFDASPIDANGDTMNKRISMEYSFNSCKSNGNNSSSKRRKSMLQPLISESVYNPKEMQSQLEAELAAVDDSKLSDHLHHSQSDIYEDLGNHENNYDDENQESNISHTVELPQNLHDLIAENDEMEQEVEEEEEEVDYGDKTEELEVDLRTLINNIEAQEQSVLDASNLSESANTKDGQSVSGSVNPIVIATTTVRGIPVVPNDCSVVSNGRPSEVSRENGSILQDLGCISMLTSSCQSNASNNTLQDVLGDSFSALSGSTCNDISNVLHHATAVAQQSVDESSVDTQEQISEFSVEKQTEKDNFATSSFEANLSGSITSSSPANPVPTQNPVLYEDSECIEAVFSPQKIPSKSSVKFAISAELTEAASSKGVNYVSTIAPAIVSVPMTATKPVVAPTVNIAPVPSTTTGTSSKTNYLMEKLRTLNDGARANTLAQCTTPAVAQRRNSMQGRMSMLESAKKRLSLSTNFNQVASPVQVVNVAPLPPPVDIASIVANVEIPLNIIPAPPAPPAPVVAVAPVPVSSIVPLVLPSTNHRLSLLNPDKMGAIHEVSHEEVSHEVSHEEVSNCSRTDISTIAKQVSPSLSPEQATKIQSSVQQQLLRKDLKKFYAVIQHLQLLKVQYQQSKSNIGKYLVSLSEEAFKKVTNEFSIQQVPYELLQNAWNYAPSKLASEQEMNNLEEKFLEHVLQEMDKNSLHIVYNKSYGTLSAFQDDDWDQLWVTKITASIVEMANIAEAPAVTTSTKADSLPPVTPMVKKSLSSVMTTTTRKMTNGFEDDRFFGKVLQSHGFVSHQKPKANQVEVIEEVTEEVLPSVKTFADDLTKERSAQKHNEKLDMLFKISQRLSFYRVIRMLSDLIEADFYFAEEIKLNVIFHLGQQKVSNANRRKSMKSSSEEGLLMITSVTQNLIDLSPVESSQEKEFLKLYYKEMFGTNLLQSCSAGSSPSIKDLSSIMQQVSGHIVTMRYVMKMLQRIEELEGAYQWIVSTESSDSSLIRIDYTHSRHPAIMSLKQFVSYSLLYTKQYLVKEEGFDSMLLLLKDMRDFLQKA